MVESGFDLALRNYAIEDSGLHARKLADDTRILCASPGYLSNNGTPEVPRDLADHRTLVFMNARLRELTTKEGGEPCTYPPPKSKSRVVCDDGASMRIAAAAGVGICMSSIWSVHEALRDGSLIHVLPDYQVADGSAIWLVYPKSNALSAKVRVFIDFLLEKIGDPPVWLR